MAITFQRPNSKMFSAFDSFDSCIKDPVGLEVLTDLDHLIFQQKATHFDHWSCSMVIAVFFVILNKALQVEVLEIQTGAEMPNKYSVKDSTGQV